MESVPYQALDEGWRAAAADDHLRRSYTEHDFDDAGWHPVPVPGHWRSVPAFAAADGPLLYRCGFDAPVPAERRRAWLGFEGLFYQGDVWLDGGYLGDTEGYFVPHGFEVTGALRARSGHALAVEVTCNASRDPHGKRNITGVLQAGSYVDESWNPGGIWRPVRVTETGPVRIAALRVVCEDASPERAVLALRAVLDSDGARRVRLRTEIGGLDHEVDQPLATGTNEVNWTVRIDRPQLWWPRALGDAVLHDVRVAVLVGDGADGIDADPSDERRLRTGLRSVRLRRWVLAVNGEPLFLKGALHGPTRAALGEAEPGEVRADVARAAEAGLDLLRVHAHVARPELYDAADEAGLLLWQDLPLHGPYARGIRRQAVRQARAMVDLLGHHPAVALWCGHDEPVARDRRASPMREIATQQLPSWNRTLLDGSVRRALARADRSRPVIAHSGVAPHVPQIEGTDTHLALGWDVGDERDLASLAATLPRLVRFVTGLSAASVPPGEERVRPLDPTDREVLDERFPRHEFTTFAAWRDATQEHQATVVRRQVEELRRLKYRPTGGFAVARLADAQPGITPALVDHVRRPKPAWEALVAACRPVIVVADPLPATVVAGRQLALDVHVVSDLRRPLADAEVTATLSWPGGEREWRWAGDAGSDACVRVGTLQVAVPDVEGDLVLELSLRLPDGEHVTNRDQARVVSRTP